MLMGAGSISAFFVSADPGVGLIEKGKQYIGFRPCSKEDDYSKLDVKYSGQTAKAFPKMMYFPFKGNNKAKNKFMDIYQQLNFSNEYKSFITKFNNVQTNKFQSFSISLDNNVTKSELGKEASLQLTQEQIDKAIKLLTESSEKLIESQMFLLCYYVSINDEEKIQKYKCMIENNPKFNIEFKKQVEKFTILDNKISQIPSPNICVKEISEGKSYLEISFFCKLSKRQYKIIKSKSPEKIL